MNARTFADFGNTLPAVHDTAPADLHEAECLSMSTRRVTPMARPASDRLVVNWPFAALLAYFVAAVLGLAWWLA